MRKLPDLVTNIFIWSLCLRFADALRLDYKSHLRTSSRKGRKGCLRFCSKTTKTGHRKFTESGHNSQTSGKRPGLGKLSNDQFTTKSGHTKLIL